MVCDQLGQGSVRRFRGLCNRRCAPTATPDLFGRWAIGRATERAPIHHIPLAGCGNCRCPLSPASDDPRLPPPPRPFVRTEPLTRKDGTWTAAALAPRHRQRWCMAWAPVQENEPPREPALAETSNSDLCGGRYAPQTSVQGARQRAPSSCRPPSFWRSRSQWLMRGFARRFGPGQDGSRRVGAGLAGVNPRRPAQNRVANADSLKVVVTGSVSRSR